MPENRPTTIAECYARAVTIGDSQATHRWAGVIPSVLFPQGKQHDLLDKFATIAAETSRSLPEPDGEAEATLSTVLCQDAAAVGCGMDDNNRVTCAQHRTWRTPTHLKDLHSLQARDNWNGECFTPGCTRRGSPWLALRGGVGHRCNPCDEAIAVMAPDFYDGMTDRAAYAKRVTEITTMDAETLAEQAVPYFVRLKAAQDAFRQMADAMGEYPARSALTALFAARDLVTDVTAANWWAAYHCAQSPS